MHFCNLITFFQHLVNFLGTATKDLRNLFKGKSYGDEDEGCLYFSTNR